jgi:HAAS
MSGSALSKAWRWSLIRSPLLNLCRRLRWMGYPNHLAFDLLAEAGLPGEVDALIRKTIKRSKLWASERAEIARELIAHTHDAIEAGRTDEEIAATFGDPKRIAKLMRRSMKRKRPLYWRAYRNMKRATGVLIVLLIVGYGSLAVRFYTGKPSIKRNYIAELNARNDGYSEDQKAWGVYRDADIEWQRLTLAAFNLQQDDNPDANFNKYRRELERRIADDPDDPQVVDLRRAFEPQLERIREAAHRPVSGMLLSDQLDSHEIEPGIWVADPAAPSSDPEIQGMLASVLLPDLSMIRKFALMLLSDADLALANGDSDRAFADVSAALGMVKQLNNPSFLINNLSAIAVYSKVGASLEDFLKRYPEAFSRDQLVAIAHEFGQDQVVNTFDLEGEIMFFDDFLQRAYTDDGHGNGRLTEHGMKMLTSNLNYLYNEDARDSIDLDDVIQSVTSPLALLRNPDRLSQHREHRTMIERLLNAYREGPASFGWILLAEEQREFDKQPGKPLTPMNLLTEAFEKIPPRVYQSQMQSQGTLAMLGIELYRYDHGRYPESLDELVPQYLVGVPEDLYNLGHPIEYERIEDRYILYSAGTDGDLDGGRDLKPANSDRHSFASRYAFQTTVENGKVVAVLDEDGKPILVNPSGPDGDWILIDMRRSPETPPSAPSDD